MYKKFGKRTIDIILSALALLVLAIPMLIIAICVKCSSKGPVLFWQKRIGRGKKPFMMPKFRSMYTETPAEMPTHMLKDPEKWITPVGRAIRRTSLDELPQIFCILFTGDMSIVGPRPALWNQDDLIAERDKYGANDIRPGLTGWAQINGRDELEISEKARLDGEYIEKMSFLFDMKCIFLTALKVIKHDGVVEGGTGSITDKKAEKEPAAK
ncbi:MAG: sugar transferase [Eubacteriales bacterium]